VVVTTYKDIQRATGLSLATISKYFNGRNVLEANREAIEAAARELDFRPNQFARTLRSRRKPAAIGAMTTTRSYGSGCWVTRSTLAGDRTPPST